MSAKPLIDTQTTSSSESVRTVLQDLDSGRITVPEYQRDSDQWDEAKKSLFIESLLNRLTVPAFFLAPLVDDETKLEVVDGQQRLTTIREFSSGSLRLVGSDDASYLDSSVHYAGKKLDELLPPFKQAFDTYKLALIQLPYGLDRGLRLEIFRRINEGGTPLSSQDIRLAYYGECEAVTYIRLVGIYDPTREGPKRMIDSAGSKYHFDWPWSTLDPDLQMEWKEWWEGKQRAIGQTASEMFLWFLIARYYREIDSILNNRDYLANQLKLAFTGRTEEVADITCSQLMHESSAAGQPRKLCSPKEMREELFPTFIEWFYAFRLNLPSSGVERYRRFALLIAAISTAWPEGPKALAPPQWALIDEFVKKPRDMTQRLGIQYPEPKGKWGGDKGQRAQIAGVYQVAEAISKKGS